MSKLMRALSVDGGIVFYGLDSTDIVREMERVHKPSAVVSAALGRLLTGALLMSATLKRDTDSITLRLNGGGATGIVVAIATGDYAVKGYAINNIVELPPRADGKLDVGGAVGRDGTLSVIKNLGLKEPYMGQVPLVSGEIAEDITSYYATSEQTPTVCALGVLVNPDLSIAHAGGFLVQLMPGVTDEEITRLEANLAKFTSVTQMLQESKTLEDILHLVLDGFEPEILDEEEARYACDCNEEHVRDMMLSLGVEELEKIVNEKEPLRVECHYCDKRYDLDSSDLLQQAKVRRADKT